MHRLTTLVLICLLTLLAGSPLAPAVAEPPDGANPATEQRQAEEALAAVEALFSPGHQRRRAPAGRGREATLLLRDLALRLDALSAADRRAARSYLARPTSSAADEPFSPRAVAPPVCGANVCVTYETGTRDAPPARDSDGDGRPDQVELTLQTMQRVWRSVVTEGGYRAPLPDAGRAADPAEGPDERLDVYLENLGAQGLYGYCALHDYPEGRTAPAYCVLDNDYAEFGARPRGYLQVTAAHEFFHAVQFAYDVWEDPWFMEGTAAWIEDELFTHVNDNRQYLAYGQLAAPARPLDRPGLLQVYGSWIFWRFLTEQLPDTSGTGLPVVMRRIWERAGEVDPYHPGTYSMDALEDQLTAQGVALTGLYSAFAEANRHPGRHYSEGSAYRTAPLERGFTVTRQRSRVGRTPTRLMHMSSRTWAFRPGSGLTGRRWKLRVALDMPRTARGSAARVTIYRRPGLAHRTVTLDPSGAGTVVVPFGRGQVRRVELTLVNASRRYRCDLGTDLSCQGVALDDDLRSTFTAQAFR